MTDSASIPELDVDPYAFDNLIEFVNKGVLPQLGVPPAAAAAAAFGAYLNSQSNTSRGVEHRIRIRDSRCCSVTQRDGPVGIRPFLDGSRYAYRCTSRLLLSE